MNNNLTMLTDFYQLTMADGHLNAEHNDIAVFDLFYRSNPFGNGYSIFAGLKQIVEYIENLEFTDDDITYLSRFDFSKKFLNYLKDFKFTGDIYAMPEGTVVFPNEPLIRVEAPIIEAQIIETTLLNIINHQSLIATKAARIVEVAGEDNVLEFGLRRGHGPSAGLYGARAAVLAGCKGTSNVMAGKDFGVPVSGTHAHSWIMSFESEATAFLVYGQMFPNACILLVDTYDTLKSGVPNAIKTFKYLQSKGKLNGLYGIRLDSGDLAYLSKEARKMLDDAGFYDAKIVASNDLDEHIIAALKQQGAKIDLWGVGTNLITAKDDPAFGAVYKLAEYNGKHKIKISENVIKVTNPGKKQVVRIYSGTPTFPENILADLIILDGEKINKKEDLTIFDPKDTWKKTTFKSGEYYTREMLEPMLINGKTTSYGDYAKRKTISVMKNYCKTQKDRLWPEYKRLLNPHIMKVDLSQQLYDLKMSLLNEEV